MSKHLLLLLALPLLSLASSSAAQSPLILTTSNYLSYMQTDFLTSQEDGRVHLMLFSDKAASCPECPQLLTEFYRVAQQRKGDVHFIHVDCS